MKKSFLLLATFGYLSVSTLCLATTSTQPPTEASSPSGPGAGSSNGANTGGGTSSPSGTPGGSANPVVPVEPTTPPPLGKSSNTEGGGEPMKPSKSKNVKSASKSRSQDTSPGSSHNSSSQK